MALNQPSTSSGKLEFQWVSFSPKLILTFVWSIKASLDTTSGVSQLSLDSPQKVFTTNPIKTENESIGASSKSDEKMDVDVQSQSISKRKLLTQVKQFMEKHIASVDFDYMLFINI